MLNLSKWRKIQSIKNYKDGIEKGDPVEIKKMSEEKTKKIIRTVWAGGNDQLLVTIPKNKGIEKGDPVEIKKIE